MKILAVLLFVIAALPQAAIACKFLDPEPDQIMGLEDNLVVAYPAAVSNIPRLANNPRYRQEFRQTILWTVVISWKGRYRPGDQFTTRQTLDRSGMCTPGAGIYTKEPLLLAFSGREPFQSFWEFSVERHANKFMYLQRKHVRGGT